LLIVGAFALLNAFLERLIGSWIERLLARRRTREIVFAVFILLMVSLQVTGMVVDRYGKALASAVQRVLPLLTAFPAGFAGQALDSAGRSHSAGFLLNLAGVAAYASVFAYLLWRRLRAQYRGEELSESRAPTPKQKIPVAAAISEEAAPLRLLPPTVAAMLMKEFRYLSRNGILILNLFLPPALILLFSYQMEFIGTKHANAARLPFSRDWFFPGAMAYVMLLLTSPAYNCFAYDGRGIQTLLTAPVRFRDVFLGKNLLLAMVLAFEAVFVGVLLTLRIGLPRLSVLVATLAALIFATLGQLVVANWASLNFPRRLEFGTFRNQRASGMAVLIALGMQLLLFGASSLVFAVGSWLGSPWLPVGVFAVLAAAAAGGYVASLDPLSRLAERKREVLLEKLCR
jgi:ABC-2 type transport system permease protein